MFTLIITIVLQQKEMPIPAPNLSKDLSYTTINRHGASESLKAPSKGNAWRVKTSKRRSCTKIKNRAYCASWRGLVTFDNNEVIINEEAVGEEELHGTVSEGGAVSDVFVHEDMLTAAVVSGA